MQEKINKILDLIIVGIEKGSQVVGEQLPELMQEYITLYTIKNLPLISGFCLIVFPFCLYKLLKYDTCEEAKGGFGLILSVLIFLSSLHFFNSIQEIVALNLAPKAYIIDQLRKDK